MSLFQQTASVFQLRGPESRAGSRGHQKEHRKNRDQLKKQSHRSKSAIVNNLN